MPRKPGAHSIAKQGTRRHDQYEATRGTSTERGYGNTRWRKARATWLKREPLCRECLKSGRTVAARVVDHIIPWQDGTKEFWDTSNWQSLCIRCHNRKSGREAHR